MLNPLNLMFKMMNSRTHVVNMFFDMHTQLRLLKNLHQILLSLLNNDEPETAFTRKAGEHRRDGTLSSVPNLCCESNQSWKQALSIIDFASKLYLTLLLSEEPSLATLLKSNNKGDGLKDLKQLRLSVINIIVEGFPAADDDNVTCVDLWLKCAFWSRILSKVLHWIQFNIGGKGVLIKRVFTIALLDASMANGTDIFSIWAGTLATACLQPKILTEIGFLSLHNAMQTSIILQCIPTKYAFLTRCMSCMASLRKVNLPHYMSTETLSEPSSSDNLCTSGKLSLPGATTPVVNDEESQVLTIDWQLFTLHRFAMLSAVQLNDLRPEQRSDVKERQFKPVIDMLHRWETFFALICTLIYDLFRIIVLLLCVPKVCEVIGGSLEVHIFHNATYLEASYPHNIWSHIGRSFGICFCGNLPT